MRDAESPYRQGFDIAVDVFGEKSDLAAISRTFLAEISYEKNRLHEAKLYLKDSLGHKEKADAWLDVYLAGYLTRMQLGYAVGDLDDVEPTVARAKSTAINRGLDKLGRLVYRRAYRRNRRCLQESKGRQSYFEFNTESIVSATIG